jgi:hypothetical protein
MSALDFYDEAFYQPNMVQKDSNPLRLNARYMAGRSHEVAFTTNGGPESMVASIIPDSGPWDVPGRGVDGSAH